MYTNLKFDLGVCFTFSTSSTNTIVEIKKNIGVSDLWRSSSLYESFLNLPYDCFSLALNVDD